MDTNIEVQEKHWLQTLNPDIPFNVTKRVRDYPDHVGDIRPLSGIKIRQNADTEHNVVLKKVKLERDQSKWVCGTNECKHVGMDSIECTTAATGSVIPTGLLVRVWRDKTETNLQNPHHYRSPVDSKNMPWTTS